MSLNHTNDAYSMFNQYPQPTTQQPRSGSYPVFSSLRTMNSKMKGLRVSFAFFQEKTYRTVDWTKQLLWLKSWVICGISEHRMRFHRLWWTVIFLKRSFLFHLFDFYCLLVQKMLFFWKVTFLSPFYFFLVQKLLFFFESFIFFHFFPVTFLVRSKS